jgi:CTP synthase (UTP-ammonia lyase)
MPTNRQERLFDEVSVVLVGKYTSLKDSYMSVIKSLEHSAFQCNRKLNLQVRISLNHVECDQDNWTIVGRVKLSRTRVSRG